LRILHLTLYREYFDQIAKGEKTEEYREDKPYWQKRLLKSNGFHVEFDEVHFTNGYGEGRPFMRVKWKDGSRGCGRITIHLGKVLEIKNYRLPALYQKSDSIPTSDTTANSVSKVYAKFIKSITGGQNDL